ncbi:MAG: TolC family protein [Candidatus Acidiferrales bacterium]
MKAQVCMVALAALVAMPAAAQENSSNEPRHITLAEAVQLALKHNHLVKIAGYNVEESQHAKDVARSGYYPKLRNDSNYLHVTDTQFIAIAKGSLGTAAGTPIPEQTAVINQGGLDLITSGTGLTQPIGELWKIRAANDVAAAEMKAARDKSQQTQNEVALAVDGLYYQLLILQSHRQAVEAKIRASESLSNERVQQVKLGAKLETSAIEANAEALEARQDLLTTDLQASDLTIKLNDAIGLPLTTKLDLDAAVGQPGTSCEREACLKLALDSHPEILEARADVEKAEAAVRVAKRAYVPDFDIFARYSYSDNVPFLARNFGTFGVHFGYDLFDGGKRNAEIGERKAQLAKAQENLARMNDEVQVRVQTSYNRLERTRDMLKVSQEVVALRTEAHRVTAQQLAQGAALQSQVDSAAAHELDANTALLQSQLEYLQAYDELEEAIGRTPQ